MGSPISIDFLSLTFDYKSNQKIVKIDNPEQNGSLSRLNLPGFTEKQWIEHFANVFIQNKKVMLISDLGERKIEDIYESIKDLNIVTLDIMTSEFQDCKLFKLFPTLEELGVSETPLSAPIFVQNFQSLTAIDVTLDDILSSNCTNLCLDDQLISDKDLNIFMRNWIKGSNPRLRKLTNTSVRHERDISDSVFFRGISQIKTRDWCDEDTFDKEFEIKNEDGVRAKVTLSTFSFIFCIEDF